jgi:hypothetical protein
VSAETTFAAETEVRYEDLLSPGLMKAADLVLLLDKNIGVLAASLRTVEEIANRLGDNKGLSKLVKSFKTDGLAAGFEEAAEKADLFGESMKAVGLDTERFAELGARMMTPMTEGMEKAQRQLAELDRQLAKTPPGHRFDGMVPGGREPEPRPGRPGEEREPRARSGAAAYRSGAVTEIGDAAMGLQMDLMVARMLADPAIKALGLAGEMQARLLVIKAFNPGTTDADMALMRKSAEDASKNTQFSALDESKILQTIISDTGFTPKQATDLLPIFSNYADVQFLAKGAAFETSIKDAIGAAHNAHHFEPEELSHFLDSLNKASMLIPEATTALVNAQKYDGALLKNEFHMTDEQVMLFNALADRAGFTGTRGGTNLANAIQRTTPGLFGSGLLKGKSAEALRHMGLVDNSGHSTIYKNGQVDLGLLLEQISKYTSGEFKKNKDHPELAEQDIAVTFRHAFGASDKLIAALSTPETMENLHQMGDQYDHMAGVNSIQKTFADDSMMQNFRTATTNVDNVFIELGNTVLPQANAALKIFNSNITALNDWISSHKIAGPAVVDTTLFGGAALAAVAIAGFGKKVMTAGFEALGGKWLYNKAFPKAPVADAIAPAAEAVGTAGGAATAAERTAAAARAQAEALFKPAAPAPAVADAVAPAAADAGWLAKAAEALPGIAGVAKFARVIGRFAWPVALADAAINYDPATVSQGYAGTSFSDASKQSLIDRAMGKKPAAPHRR